MKDNSDFYERIKELLKNNDLTLVSALDKAGIKLDTYKSCKRYGNLPRADEVMELAKVLNTTIEYLITGQEDNIYKNKYENLVAAIKELPL